MVRTSHTPDSAKQAWPAGVAVGKLNVVFVEGKEPRLVLDSSICQVNKRCTLPERVAMPLAFDLKLAHCPADPPGAFLGASFAFQSRAQAGPSPPLGTWTTALLSPRSPLSLPGLSLRRSVQCLLVAALRSHPPSPDPRHPRLRPSPGLAICR